MCVSVEHSVDVPNPLANRLLTKVRRGIDQDELAGVFDEDRRPQAAIMRIGRRADCAITADGGHAHGRTAAQHGERGSHLLPESAPVAWGGRDSALVTST